MYIDRDFEEFPYEGRFYEYRIRKNLPLDKREADEQMVLVTKCDIQESESSKSGGNLSQGYDVYFPLDASKDVYIKRGMKFRASKYGIDVNGVVDSVGASSLGVVCHIKDVDV